MAADKVQRPEFFKVYIPHINSKILPLPLGFNRHISHPLSATALIRNHSGNCWRVGFSRRNGFVCFESGWTNFVNENQLGLGEFMVFEYEAPRTFLVSIYGVSTCREKRGQVVIQEIPEEDDEDVVDIGDHSYTSADVVDIGDYSYASADVVDIGDHSYTSEDVVDIGDYSYTSDSLQTQRLIRPKKHEMSVKEGKSPRHYYPLTPGEAPSDENLEKYLDNPANPFFTPKLKTRNLELLVPSRIVKDHNLEFSKKVTFVDPRGTMVGRLASWKDKRVCFKKWNCICRRNGLKDKDTVICELQKTGSVVDTIKVHVIR